MFQQFLKNIQYFSPGFPHGMRRVVHSGETKNQFSGARRGFSPTHRSEPRNQNKSDIQTVVHCLLLTDHTVRSGVFLVDPIFEC